MSNRVGFSPKLTKPPDFTKLDASTDETSSKGKDIKNCSRKNRQKFLEHSHKSSQFSSLKEETHNQGLEVLGEIPDWIDGSYYKNGPALFEIGSESFSHWLDGQAMIHLFKFKDGKTTYSNKFLQSSNLKKHLESEM